MIVENIEEVTASRVQVYPNPAEDIVRVILPQGVRGMRVLNATGQMVYSDVNASLAQQIDVSQWAAGVYRVEATGLSGVTLVVK